MSLITQKSSDGKTITIKTDNKFDYSSHTDFRASYNNETEDGISYIIDMRNTDYMDSSALGMLLLLREHAGNNTGNISIINCNQEIKNILEISNFQKLFTIS
jgi:anti-anti-sigma factor